MDKLNKKKHLWLAASFAASVVAFGCTTNHNLGNGTPTRSGPDVRTAPTSGVTTGGETYTPPMPPPMTSSYSRPEALPKVTATTRATTRSIRRSPDEAAAIMRGHQASRGGVYLGVSNPGPNRSNVNVQTGQFINPAMLVNPQVTVNSSISSQPTSVINTGAGESVAGVPTNGTTAPLPLVASSGVPSVTVASNSAPVRIQRTTSGAVTVTNVGTTTSTTSGNQ